MSIISNAALTAGDLARRGVAFAAPIAQAAARHNVDPLLLASVAAQETGGPGSSAGRNIVGDGGHGRGVFQIDDRWHDFARTSQAMDPSANADYAAGMIHGLLQKYGGDVHRALSAYNAGSPDATGTVTDWGNGKQLGYADSVMRHYVALAGGGVPQSEGGAATADQLTQELLAEAPSAFQSINALGNFAGTQTQQPQHYTPTEGAFGSLINSDEDDA
ncbi:MAG: transglycosylase SLT domain-containing protein [Candidatus Eremiobacteraeota bacterium]|nr:transglycosylase SLT domain-containing protein [Candidatus Eremiobacteraeota bacterium]